MKTYKLIFPLMALVIGLVMQSCKDNILKPVANNKSADSLTALINALSAKLIAVNAKDKTFKIQLAKFNSKKDSLNAVSPDNNWYGQAVEYTVYVIDGSTTVIGNGLVGGRGMCKNCKVAGVDGATVTVLSNGAATTATSADGRAIFSLKVAGLVTVNITAPGYTSCSFTTYFNPDNDYADQTGAAFSVSTNVMLLPTSGNNMTTYTGQVYINKSTLDDTLGRQYNDPTDAARYRKFISSYGPYHGSDQTDTWYSSQYLYGDNFGAYGAQNIKFDNLTALSGVNFIYGFPANVASYYQAYDLTFNYNFLPGDIISLTYTGLTAFAAVNASGAYTLAIPTYANQPGVYIGTSYSDWYGYDGNNINYQDSITYLTSSGSQIPGAKAVTLKYYDNGTYLVSNQNYDKITQFFEYFPYIEMDPPDTDNTNPADYSEIDSDPQYFNGQPGQTYIRHIFFFSNYLTGN